MTVGVRPAVVHRIDHTGQCMKVLLGIFRIVLVWVKVARNATHTDAPSHFFLLYSFSARLFRIMYKLEADEIVIILYELSTTVYCYNFRRILSKLY